MADKLRSNFGVLNDRQEAFSSGLEAVETSLGEVGFDKEILGSSECNMFLVIRGSEEAFGFFFLIALLRRSLGAVGGV